MDTKFKKTLYLIDNKSLEFICGDRMKEWLDTWFIEKIAFQNDGEKLLFINSDSIWEATLDESKI